MYFHQQCLVLILISMASQSSQHIWDLSTFVLVTSSSSPSVRAAWCDPEAREQQDLELELKGFTVSLT